MYIKYPNWKTTKIFRRRDVSVQSSETMTDICTFPPLNHFLLVSNGRMWRWMKYLEIPLSKVYMKYIFYATLLIREFQFAHFFIHCSLRWISFFPNNLIFFSNNKFFQENNEKCWWKVKSFLTLIRQYTFSSIHPQLRGFL